MAGEIPIFTLYPSNCIENVAGFCKSPTTKTVLPPTETIRVISFTTPEGEDVEIFACNATRGFKTPEERRGIEVGCSGYCPRLVELAGRVAEFASR